MPLTKSGKSIMRSMTKQYGKEKAKEVFYASINAGKAGTEKWHKNRKTYTKKMSDLTNA